MKSKLVDLSRIGVLVWMYPSASKIIPTNNGLNNRDRDI